MSVFLYCIRRCSIMVCNLHRITLFTLSICIFRIFVFMYLLVASDDAPSWFVICIAQHSVFMAHQATDFHLILTNHSVQGIYNFAIFPAVSYEASFSNASLWIIKIYMANTEIYMCGIALMDSTHDTLIIRVMMRDEERSSVTLQGDMTEAGLDSITEQRVSGISGHCCQGGIYVS